ncbi:MAG: NADH-quinone oxidoreductase subunit C [Actinomycetota bacterium]|nr:NADH-quinone oxidoreductase subunit C [Actinomycetota bacterium]
MLVAPEVLGQTIAGALDDKGRLAALFADPVATQTRLVAVVAGPNALTVLEANLGDGERAYPSVTAVVPGADWYEREIHDLYGLLPDGHPDLDPLVLPRDPGVLPPRPGALEPSPPIAPSATPLRPLVHGEGLFTLPYGPVRSGIVEAIEYVLETPGEDFPRIQTRPHYKHRGVEAAFVGRSVADGVLLAERVEGVASVAHAIAYCEAVERLASVEVPPRAQLVRVVHAELERIANHLDSTIHHAEAAGQAVAHARLTVHKERLMRLRAALCGSRFGRGVVVPGGVRARLGRDSGALLEALDPLVQAIEDDLRLLMATPSFLDRLRGTGILPGTVMVARGGLGPLARGSGVPEDVRAARPYGAYGRLGFPPAVFDDGDALARQRVRNEEMASSFHLIRQALDELAELRENLTEAWEVAVPACDGEAFGWAEAPQGEVLYFVRARNGCLARVKPRSASFHNLALFTAAFPKDITTDFAFIEASFGLSTAGAAG